MGSAVCFYLSESTRILLSDKFGLQKSNWQRWMSRVLRYVYCVCVCFILKGTKFKKKKKKFLSETKTRQGHRKSLSRCTHLYVNNFPSSLEHIM